jgi:aminobenzoyl-glutamate utilization protein B
MGVLLIVGLPGGGLAQPAVEALVAERLDAGIALADTIWSYAELGYLEYQSSRVLREHMAEQGFAIEETLAGIPTAFVASYGQGRPVIGILAEFDALPGLSQATVPERQPLIDGGAGHACGHHLFGAASATAAVALARWLDTSDRPGTVRLFGTPAEEGGSGKVYLTRAGLFDDVDVVLHWHPSDRNSAAAASSTANKSGRGTWPVCPGWSGSHEFHGQPDARARALGCPAPLRDHRWGGCAEHSSRDRSGVLLRPPSAGG